MLGGGAAAIVVGGVGGISIGTDRGVDVNVALAWLCGNGLSLFLDSVLALSSLSGGRCCWFRLPVEAKTVGGLKGEWMLSIFCSLSLRVISSSAGLLLILLVLVLLLLLLLVVPVVGLEVGFLAVELPLISALFLSKNILLEGRSRCGEGR